VLEACLAAGINVPEEVAVLGVDNTDTLCDCLCVPLSGVDSNLGRVGYEGAALLDRLMSRRAAAPKRIEVPPAGIVERRSADAYAVEQPRVRQALQFIQEQCASPGQVFPARKPPACRRSWRRKVEPPQSLPSSRGKIRMGHGKRAVCQPFWQAGNLPHDGRRRR
jgi:LacI family transcriptional regulator